MDCYYIWKILIIRNMKKVLFIAIGGMFLFASCKRDWKCVCSNSEDSGTTSTYTDVSRKEAKESCNSIESIGKAFDSSVNCKIEKN